jgi:predicted RNase H-like HicB family nuclease
LIHKELIRFQGVPRGGRKREKAFKHAPENGWYSEGGFLPLGLPYKGLCATGSGMASHYTAITKQDGEWWIGWIEEVPGVNAQERTKEELLASLRETLKEALGFLPFRAIPR